MIGAALRSLAFYAAFYPGTAAYVLAALAAAALRPSAMPRVVRAWSRFHRRCTTVLLGFQIEVKGELPAGGALIAMKHESFFEAIDLPQAFGMPAIFAKAELLRIPLWGRVAGRYGLISVERDQGAKALRAMRTAALAHHGAGRSLAIFPEGTRVRHGLRPPLQSGFAGLYKLMGLPVVPIAVDSGPFYHRFWKRPGTITYLIGEPVPPGLPRAEAEQRVHAAINALNPGSPR